MQKKKAISALCEVRSMQLVLENCFENDPESMRRAAEYFAEHGRPPKDLGRPYREALGSRPRGRWWASVLSRLQGLAPSELELEIDVDSISQLESAWAAVAKGRTVLLSRDGRRIGRVLPLKRGV